MLLSCGSNYYRYKHTFSNSIFVVSQYIISCIISFYAYICATFCPLILPHLLVCMLSLFVFNYYILAICRNFSVCLTWCLSGRASWIDSILITNLMHWLIFIHKILFSSTCFESQVLIFRRLQLYTCSIWYFHSLWEFVVACRYTAWVRTDWRGKIVGGCLKTTALLKGSTFRSLRGSNWTFLRNIH